MASLFERVRHLTWRGAQVSAVFRALRLARKHAVEFGRRPVLAVIGARFGVVGVARELAKRGALDVIGFEPDAAEIARLRTSQPFVRFEPFGDVDAPHNFYLTSNPGCSSCLEPDMAVLHDYPVGADFRVERALTVQLSRLDTLHAQQAISFPDFIQMDVQGFEGKVLEGLGEGITHLVGLQAESHFKPLYKGQLLLPDLRSWLDKRGFILRDLRPSGTFEGELVEADVWYTRKPTASTPQQLSLARIWETLCVLPAPWHYHPSTAPAPNS